MFYTKKDLFAMGLTNRIISKMLPAPVPGYIRTSHGRRMAHLWNKEIVDAIIKTKAFAREYAISNACKSHVFIII